MDYQDSINDDAGHYKLPGASHRDYAKKMSNISLVDINEISSQFKHSTPDENSTLHLASIGGNISQVRYCLEVLKYDPNSFNQQGKNALHLAVQAGHDNITHYLAQNEVSLACGVENGLYTPLHLAALNGHFKLVQVFVSKHEMDPLLCTSDLDQGITPLQCACINGNLAVVKFLTEEAQKYEPIIDFINVTTSTGDTLLHSAALSGCLEVTEFLVESCNMKPNPANDNGVTPFHIAVHAGNIKLVIFYMSCKDINITQSVESTGQNALHIAATQCHTDVVKHLIVNSKIDPTAPDLLGCTPLHYAALCGSLEIVEFLLDIAKGIDLLKVVDNEDQTVFHFAVRSGNLPLVKLLARYQMGVISSIDKRGWSSLHHAVDTNGSRFPEMFSNSKVTVTGDDQVKIIDFLVNEMKCDLTSRTSGGLTIHHLHCNLKIAQYLIKDLKCDPNSCDVDGMNALHHTCLAGKVETVRYLVDECGYDLTQLDNRGHSVVHYACWNGNIDLLKFLLIDKRCEILPENEKGLTPLHYSAFFGQLSIFQFYKEQLGVDLNSACTTWLLYHACMGGNLVLVKYLLDECDYKELGAGRNGVSLLQFAACQRHILEYLVVEKHCDPSYVDALGNTPLHDSMDLESFKYLLNFIEYDKPNNQGVTPLHIVCEFGKLAIVRYLVKERKANLSVKCNDGRMPIHFAAQAGQVYVLKYLVEQGRCYPSCTDSNGNTPLHFACSLHLSYFFHESYLNGICAQISHFKTVEVLIRDSNCNPDCVNNNKQTPLHLACQYGYADIVKYLVEKCKCNPYVEDKDKMVPLFVACQYGWVDIVKFLADYFRDSKYKKISLSIACKYGQCKVVQYLIENLNCDIVGTDNSGLVPLWYACDGQHKEVIEYLTNQMIAIGSSAIKILLDHNITEKSGAEWISPLQVACEKGDLNTIKLLASKGTTLQQTTLLHFACRGGKIDTIQYLIEEYAVDVNSQGNEGDTPLHIAAMLGHVDVIKCLIEARCDPLCKNVYGNTPAHLAALNGHLPALKYFIEQMKFDLSITNEEGQMVIHYACCIKNIDIVQYLVEECSDDISSIDQEGNTPLLKAAMNGQLTVIEYLIKRGCDPGQRNTYGNTPLHVAASNGHLSVVKYYTKHLVHDPNTANDQGQNCLHIACSRGRMEVIRYLVEECSIDIDKKDKEGSTSILLASVYGHLAVVKYLITKGGDLLQRGAFGFSPIDAAIIGEQLSVLKYFKEKDYYDFNSVNNVGMTAIHCACAVGNLDIVKYLVEECSVEFLSVIKFDIAQYASSTSTLLKDQKMCLESLLPKPTLGLVNQCLILSKQGVDPNLVFDTGLAPLHNAAANGHLLVVEYLLAQGCDPLCRDLMGNTPMHHAAGNGHLTIVKYYKKHLHHDPNTANDQGQNCLHLACCGGKMEVVRYLVEECSIDINNKDKQGNTPVVLASVYGHLAVIEYLITKGCDLQQRGGIGLSLIDAAIKGEQLSVLKSFKEKDCYDFNSVNSFGMTAIHFACALGNLDIVKYLVEECSVDFLSVIKLDIAQYASSTSALLQDKTCLESLLPKPLLGLVNQCLILSKQGVDPNLVFDTGLAPLHNAASNGHLLVVEYLIEQGCDPLCCDLIGNTSMHHAACNGHLTVVKYFNQQQNCDLNYTNNMGQMAIHLASFNGKIDVVQYLVEESAIDLMNEDDDGSTPLVAAAMPQDSQGNTPLHFAVIGAQLEIVKFYINNLINDLGLDPNTPNNIGATPLHLACLAGSLQMVKLFGECDICDFSVKDSNDGTLLHYVSWQSGDAAELIMYLVRDKNCDPAISDINGNTCLHLASQNGTLEIVQLLVCEFDCDPNCMNAQGNTPLQLASKDAIIDFFLQLSNRNEDHNVLPLFNPKVDFLKQLVPSGTGPEKVSQLPIFRAIKLDNPDQVNYHILDMGCSLIATDTNGNTYLHIAALHGAIRVAQLLLNTFECDPNCENAQGATPLHLACAKGDKRIVDLLLSNYKCQTSSKDKNGQTPLHYAVLHSELDIIEKLARQVCDLMISDNTGHTPLHCAIQCKDVEILSFFLFEKQCDLQVKSKDGNSYLHFAAKGGQLDVVQLICLMPDLNPCASNKYGCTPLDIATVYHNQEVVQFLQQHTTSTHSPPSVIHLSTLLGHISSIQHYIADLQYDPDLRDSTGRTPLHYAAMGGHLIITQYLVSSDADSLSEDVLHNLPLHYAAALGHQDVVQFLVNIGSPLTARGVWDKTPAEMAAAGGHKNVLDYLDSLQDDDGLDWVREV